jgi:hypothetical protein
MSKQVCSVEGCANVATAKGLCPSHYEAAKKRGEFGSAICSAEGCQREATTDGLCASHHRAAKGE